MDQTLKSLNTEIINTENQIADIYLLGVGTVGSELLDIIGKESSQEITIRKVGSSKKMIVGNDAVNPITAMDDLNKLGV